MSARPVHYAAHGTGALAFACFYRELRAHLDSGRDTATEHGHARKVYAVKTPRRHTDLSRVTCPECWREIARMVAAALPGATGRN